MKVKVLELINISFLMKFWPSELLRRERFYSCSMSCAIPHPLQQQTGLVRSFFYVAGFSSGEAWLADFTRSGLLWVCHSSDKLNFFSPNCFTTSKLSMYSAFVIQSILTITSSLCIVVVIKCKMTTISVVVVSTGGLFSLSLMRNAACTFKWALLSAHLRMW